MNRYSKIIETLFFNNYQKGNKVVKFNRDEIPAIAKSLNIKLPKNLGDVIYSFRYRSDLPESIVNEAPKDFEWVIKSLGSSNYSFQLVRFSEILVNPQISEIKILDSTPAIIERYAQNDEQALLAKIRYNRLIDIFTGLTCYSLQNHFRTSVKGIGQIETDEIYIGVNSQGTQFVLPVEAKGEKDRLGIVQIDQDINLCKEKFPELICFPIAAQFVRKNVIALFLLEENKNEISILSERHYKLVRSKDLSSAEIKKYQNRFIPN
jgi:hypothetical protein